MRTFWTIVLLAAIIILVGVIVTSDRPNFNNGGNNGTSTNGGGNTNGTSTNATSSIQNMIRVTSPQPNSMITSPLTVTGDARGNWYFEADFPVRLLDANGRQIAIGIAQAQGDWMTTNFVPFRAVITFSNPTTSTGTLVLEKDNPSGLPQNAAEVRIPIRFGQATTTQTRNIKLYFYDQNRDRDQAGNILCSAQGLVAIDRTIPLTNTPIQDAVRELLKGPTSSERPQIPNTGFPLSGVTLTGANLANGVLTLSFNDPNNTTSGGSCKVGILRAQIEATAKQFGGVSQVRFSPVGVFEP